MSSRHIINLISWQSEVYYKNQKELPSQQGHLSFFLLSPFCVAFSSFVHLPIKRGSLFEDNTDKLTRKHISSGRWGQEFRRGPWLLPAVLHCSQGAQSC